MRPMFFRAERTNQGKIVLPSQAQADVLDLLCQHLAAAGGWGGFLSSDHLTERNTPDLDI